MKTDVLIVGGGISGCVLAWRWLLEGKSVCLVSDDKQSSSYVAAGVFNPVVLKRFTPVWNATQQLDELAIFFESISSLTGIKLLHKTPILRRFHNESEIKTWKKKSLKTELSALLNSDLYKSELAGIEATYGYGKVNRTGWVNTMNFIAATVEHKSDRLKIQREKFDQSQLRIVKDAIYYKELMADRIIYAEGMRMNDNEFFKHIRLIPNKGQVLIIKSPGLVVDHIIKSSVFLMPYKEDLFWVGATYEREFDSPDPTSEGMEFLTSRLNQFLKVPYTVVSHLSGVRPTTMDRRPLVGTHNQFDNVHLFNGMGSRSVLIAPWASRKLYDHIYMDLDLPVEMNISRFDA
ncbi:MAG: FAD-binding oxidoreductase [Nonlabens sp.]